MNLANSAKDAKRMPSITTLACTDKTIDSIESVLGGLIQLVKIARINIGKEIREFINAVHKAAISL